MPPEAAQRWLREVFARWGLPQALRVDNGWPWGSSGDLPPVLALWLIGLGVSMHWNRPRRPQENGKVERFHGLVDQWGEPEQCPDFLAWVDRVAWAVRVQREEYPSIRGQSRSQAYPQLYHPQRRYTVAQEAAQWQLDRVEQVLAQGRWKRQVGKKGQITLYHRPYGVGRAYAGQTVWVRFDPQDHTWVIQNDRGQEVGRHPAGEITQQAIMDLQVSYVKPHQRQGKNTPNFIAHFVT